MAESRSLMVRSGITTSFWATTLVTRSFVTVFMMGTREKRKGGTPLTCQEKKVGRGRGRGRCNLMGFQTIQTDRASNNIP